MRHAVSQVKIDEALFRPPRVVSSLILGGLSRRDEPNDIATLTDAVTHHENAQFGAHAE